MGNSDKCHGCMGDDKCNEYCEKHLGKAIYRLLYDASTLELEIGKPDKSSKSDKYDLMVIGHDVSGADHGRILSSRRDMSLVLKDVMHDAFGKRPGKILIDMNDSEEYREAMKEIVNNIYKINNSKMVVIPFRYQTGFKATNGGSHPEDYRLESIRWKVSLDTGKINMSLYMKKLIGDVYITKPIEEYNKSFWLSNEKIVYSMDNYKESRDVIVMQSCGLISTIEIRGSDGKSLVADNSYIYWDSKEKDGKRVIAYWNNDGYKGIDISDDIESSKQYKKFRELSSLIFIHKKYIIPYGLCNTNIIEV